MQSLTRSSSTEVSDEMLGAAVRLALDSGQEQGRLKELSLRFMVWQVSDSETRIAFSDLSWERSSLTRLLVSSLLVGLAALSFFFLISLFLSRLALRPVSRAWEQQNQFTPTPPTSLKRRLP